MNVNEWKQMWMNENMWMHENKCECIKTNVNKWKSNVNEWKHISLKHILLSLYKFYQSTDCCPFKWHDNKHSYLF